MRKKSSAKGVCVCVCVRRRRRCRCRRRVQKRGATIKPPSFSLSRFLQLLFCWSGASRRLNYSLFTLFSSQLLSSVQINFHHNFFLFFLFLYIFYFVQRDSKKRRRRFKEIATKTKTGCVLFQFNIHHCCCCCCCCCFL